MIIILSVYSTTLVWYGVDGDLIIINQIIFSSKQEEEEFYCGMHHTRPYSCCIHSSGFISMNAHTPLHDKETITLVERDGEFSGSDLFGKA